MAESEPPRIGGYSRSKGREQSPKTVRRPHLLRLEAALHAGRTLQKSDDWVFDAKVFRARPEGDHFFAIGNLPGRIASLNQMRQSDFQLQPMAGGVALFTTKAVRDSLSFAYAVPPHVPPDTRWFIDNVSWTCGDTETFGWHAVCEYFSLGMWDARRIFQGYGYPSIPTLEATLAYLEQFVKLRRKDIGE